MVTHQAPRKVTTRRGTTVRISRIACQPQWVTTGAVTRLKPALPRFIENEYRVVYSAIL
jgi:hypothetical protein